MRQSCETRICGSSPRARGTLWLLAADKDGERFIPAGAGNTQLQHQRAGKRSVHPRGRGEHRDPMVYGCTLIGSSPRARGTRFARPLASGCHRFIPAGAGNTLFGERPAMRRPVHPRGRGEHDQRIDLNHRLIGSSPRARGTRSTSWELTGTRRFIPAGAGNTSVSAISRRSSAVHPRGRGEHFPVNFYGGDYYGSSPRARGTLTPPPCCVLSCRFIPAGAGNTYCM